MTISAADIRHVTVRETPRDLAGAKPVAVLIRAVRKRYGSVLALDDIDIEIKRGEFFSLLGPSGCGKTTLLRIIGGFEELDGGQILIDGVDCADVPAYRRQTNMIFQHLALFPHMSVFENVAFGLRRKRVPVAQIATRVREALALVRLDGFDGRLPAQLSGGQRQRVAMARAIVNNPSVLLLDEPLGSLDLQLRLQMQEELRRLHRSLGGTFIFVTHDQGEAMTMSDRIAVMNGGRIQQIGSPEEIYESPRTRFVASFIGHTNLIAGTIEAIETGGGYIVNCSGYRFACRGSPELTVGERVIAALRYEKIDLVTSADPPRRPSFVGRVTDRTYMGSAVRLQVDIGNDVVITADLGDVERAREVAVGDEIRLGVAEGTAVAVPHV